MNEPSLPADPLATQPASSEPATGAADAAHVTALVPVTRAARVDTPPSTPRWNSTLGVVAAAVAGAAIVTILAMTAWPSAREAAPTPAAVSAMPRASAPITSAAPPAAAAVPAVSPAVPPGWTDRQRTRWVGRGSKGVAFEVPAIRPIKVWNGSVTPLLVVRCLDKRTDVFVYTETAAALERQDENHSVRLAFDAEEPAGHRWPDSVEHDALFAPDGAVAARQVMAASVMRFEFSPHNAATATAVFDVRGLRDRLQPHARQCGAAF